MAESLAIGCALVVCVMARLPQRILDAAGIQGWGLALVVVVAVVTGARALARAPFTLLLPPPPDRAAAFRRGPASEIKTAVVAIFAGTVVSLPLYALLRATPAWWLIAWLMFAAVTVVWQLATPLVMRAQAGPLVARPAGTHRSGCRPSPSSAGVDLGGGVVVAGKPGSRRCNAYVVGLGPTRRSVLEQAVAAWPPELVDQVVAHELGHWRLGHAARRLPLTILCRAGHPGRRRRRSVVRTAARLGRGRRRRRPRSYPLLLVVGAVRRPPCPLPPGLARPGPGAGRRPFRPRPARPARRLRRHAPAGSRRERRAPAPALVAAPDRQPPTHRRAGRRPPRERNLNVHRALTTTRSRPRRAWPCSAARSAPPCSSPSASPSGRCPGGRHRPDGGLRAAGAASPRPRPEPTAPRRRPATDPADRRAPDRPDHRRRRRRGAARKAPTTTAAARRRRRRGADRPLPRRQRRRSSRPGQRVNPTSAEVQAAITPLHQRIPLFEPNEAQLRTFADAVCTSFDQGQSLAQVQATVQQAVTNVQGASLSAADAAFAVRTVLAAALPRLPARRPGSRRERCRSDGMIQAAAVPYDGRVFR